MTKILVIRFSSIGDIVLTSPIIRCLKQQLPACEVHVLTKTQYQSLYRTNPYIDKLHLWGDNPKATLKELKKEKFYRIIDLHKNIRTARIKLSLRKKAISFPKLNIKKWLLVNVKWNKLPTIHIVDRYFKAVQPLGVKNDGKGLDFFIQIDYNHFQHRFPLKENYVAVAIGGQFNTKKMPPEKLSEVLKGLPLPVVLIGGSEDRENGQKIVSLLPNQKISNACGGFTIHESAQIIKNATVLVTHDTGMMHIGAAFNLPLVTLWGNTVPDFGMYPYRPTNPTSFSIHEVNNLPCRPCSKIGYDKCPKGHFKCMMSQDTTAIRKKVIQYIEADKINSF